MACYRPIIVEPIKKGQKVKFLRISTEQKYHKILNNEWKTTNMLPCKKCIGCKTDHAKEWAIRAALETKYSKENYFITLTYSETYKPKNNSVKNKELTTFIKSLRKHYERIGHTRNKIFSSERIRNKNKKTTLPHMFF